MILVSFNGMFNTMCVIYKRERERERHQERERERERFLHRVLQENKIVNMARHTIMLNSILGYGISMTMNQTHKK